MAGSQVEGPAQMLRFALDMHEAQGKVGEAKQVGAWGRGRGVMGQSRVMGFIINSNCLCHMLTAVDHIALCGSSACTASNGG